MTANCDWRDPGAQPYTGTARAAIHAYGLPAPTTAALIAAFEARRWADRVAITRDAITGAVGYAPDIRDMHFGGTGKVCRKVTRKQWPRGHTEHALVFCADGVCVAWPEVCRNFFRVTLTPVPAPELATLPGPELSTLPGPELSTLPGPELSTLLGPALATLPGPELATLPGPELATLPGPAWGTGGGAGTVYPIVVPWLTAAPTPPIPEPPASALLLAGLGGVLLWRWWK